MIRLLHQFLEQTAQASPLAIAAKVGSEQMRFDELRQASTALAAHLQMQGIKRGDRVVLCLGNSLETIIAFWAILKAGAIAIPIGSEVKQDKIVYILKDSGARFLMTTPEKVDLIQPFLEEQQQLVGIYVHQLKEAQPLLVDFESAVTSQVVQYTPPSIIDLDLAAIIYTSGSTGEPKGVMLTHQNMVAAAHSLNTYLAYKAEDRVLCAIPLSFDYGLYQMIMAVCQGACLVLVKEFSWPVFILKTILQERVSVIPAVPSLVMLLHKQNLKSKHDLSFVRMVTNTGAALTKVNIEMIKQTFSAAQIFSMYGLTECKRCTYLPPEDIDRKPESVGFAIPNTELWLIDEHGQRIETPFTPGQLVIRGANVMKGYWNKPEKTEEKIRQHPLTGENLLYTGDLCHLDDEGYLYFNGRMDEVIKSRGIKVSPKEIEDFLLDHPAVQAAAVIGYTHPTQGQVPYAFVSLQPDADAEEEELLSYCKEHLESYKIPLSIKVLASFPKTPNGKFNKLELKKMASANEEQYV